MVRRLWSINKNIVSDSLSTIKRKIDRIVALQQQPSDYADATIGVDSGGKMLGYADARLGGPSRMNEPAEHEGKYQLVVGGQDIPIAHEGLADGWAAVDDDAGEIILHGACRSAPIYIVDNYHGQIILDGDYLDKVALHEKTSIRDNDDLNGTYRVESKENDTGHTIVTLDPVIQYGTAGGVLVYGARRYRPGQDMVLPPLSLHLDMFTSYNP